MKQILILGAGKSSAHLIKYLSSNAANLDVGITIVDIKTDHIPKDVLNPRVCVCKIDLGNPDPYSSLIERSDIVISMLPASMHINIAKRCITFSKHLITPSYISNEMMELDAEAKTKKLIFLNEMGFDPGIDHMTTMQICRAIEAEGGKLVGYKSYAGGLVAPRSDSNPWNYKFSWNPKNVILAGQGGEIQYLLNKEIVKLDYLELFSKSEKIVVSDDLHFDGYANRDSMKYEKLYGWKNMETLIRGTLRRVGFCKAWNEVIHLGLTDNSSKCIGMKGKSFSYFYQSFVKEDVENYFNNLEQSIQTKFTSIGFHDENSTIKIDGTPAEILQSILEDKWRLEPNDTDYIAMVHFFEYVKEGQRHQIKSFLTMEGEDDYYTAMSKTVGMPIAFACEQIVKNEIKSYGVLMPTVEEIYKPILRKLEAIGVRFDESSTILGGF